MPDRAPTTKLLLVLAAVLSMALPVDTIASAAQPAGGTKTSTRNCSVTGLHYSAKQGGVTLGVAVANLKARSVTCPAARSLAGTVARDLLHETKVPARIAGLAVTVKEPCAGCAPDTQVRAASGQELVTFTVKGGV